MKLTSLRRPRTHGLPGITGTARLDRRTKNIARRVRPGDVAIIDHIDIDRSAAVALVEAQVAAVVNIAPSISGRYPNLGPGVLLDAGIPLLDEVGSEAFMAVNDGDAVRLDGDTLYRGETPIATGRRHDADSVAAALDASREGMSSQLEAFSANAIEHLRRERGLLLDGEGVPAVSTDMRDRHVLVVLRAFDYRSDLKALKTYIREVNPVLVGVDAGADALLQAGHRPDLIVVEGGEISDAGMRCGAEVVAHAKHDGRVRGGDRLERLGVPHATFVTRGSSEDAAILLAHGHDAALIVLAGSHASLVEFLDKGRSGMASSFLTRATVGSKIADAKAVAQLYQNRVSGWLVSLLVLLALAAVVAAIATTPVGQDWWQQVQEWFDTAISWVQERL